MNDPHTDSMWVPRLGKHLLGRQYELYFCDCPPERPCPPPEVCRQYRDLYEAEAMVTTAPRWARLLFRHWWMSKAIRYLPDLSIPINFCRALSKHAKDWFRLVSFSEYQRRVSVCTRCVYYSKDYPGGRCAKCGCGIQGQVGDREIVNSSSPSWWQFRSRIKRRWGKVWGKAHWNSEDCPVCSHCEKTRGEGCGCNPYVSKWRRGLVLISVGSESPK